VLNGKSNTPPSTTASHSALPQGRLCGLGKGEEVKTERKKLFIRIGIDHSVGYVGKGNKKIKKKKKPRCRGTVYRYDRCFLPLCGFPLKSLSS